MIFEFTVKGLDCAHCAEKLRAGVENADGVEAAYLNFMTKKLRVTVSGNSAKIKKAIISAAKKAEPEAELLEDEAEEEERPLAFDLVRIIAGILIAIAGAFIPEEFKLYMFLAAYLVLGWDVLLKAVKNIFKGKVFDENFLMSIATVGAFFLGDYPEAAAVMAFYQVGELFQEYAVRRSRKSIRALMELRPDSARVITEEGVKEVMPEEVLAGQKILVAPGERIPLDGKIISGESYLETSALTGESVPRFCSAGDEALSGAVNQTGTLTIEVTRIYGESTVAKILDLTENAGSRKSQSERFITRFAKWYTPAVVAGALILAVVPPLFTGDSFSFWLSRALIFLVVSCPCALVISVPMSFFGGIGAASRNGILIKGGGALENLAKCNTAVFDKTGTLTEGAFEVSGVYPIRLSEEEFLRMCSIAEGASSHPIACSVRRAAGEMSAEELSELSIEEIAGKGVKTVFRGKTIIAGNKALMNDAGISCGDVNEGTVLHLAVDGGYEGYLTVSDRLRETTPKAVSDLKRLGVSRTVMLTGDTEAAAESIAKSAGVDEYHAGLLPEDKVKRLEELLSDESRVTLFAGDGINDAPALARADIGVAMGGLGADAAVEAADMVLMHDDIGAIAKGIKIARHTVSIVRQNIVFALTVKAVVLILGACGIATMWLAVFADVGVAVLAVLNALRSGAGIKKTAR